jgi:regulatory protein
MPMEELKSILHYCKYQERCHAEVRNKLYELGFTSVDVERLLTELIATDVVNEERFARAFARGKFRMKQWGREKIKIELKQRKISDYCIKKALTEIDGDEYDNTLNKLVDKKLVQLKADRSEISKKGKLYRYLVQKGYERDIVISIINEHIKKK